MYRAKRYHRVGPTVLTTAMVGMAWVSQNAMGHPDPTQWATYGEHCVHQQLTRETDILQCQGIRMTCDDEGTLSAANGNGEEMQVIGRDGGPKKSPWAGIAEMLEISEQPQHELTAGAVAEQDWVRNDSKSGRGTTYTTQKDILPITRFARSCMGKLNEPPGLTYRRDPDPRRLTHPGGVHAKRPCTAITSTVIKAPEAGRKAALQALNHADGPAEQRQLNAGIQRMWTVERTIRELDAECGRIDSAEDPHEACRRLATDRFIGGKDPMVAMTGQWVRTACKHPDRMGPSWLDILERAGIPTDDLPRPIGGFPPENEN